MESLLYSVNTDNGWEEKSYNNFSIIGDSSEIQLLRTLAYKLSVDEESANKFFIQKKSVPEIVTKDVSFALLVSGADIKKQKRVTEGNRIYKSNSLAASFGISEIVAEEFKREGKAACPKCGKALRAWMFPELDKGVLCLALKPSCEMQMLTVKDITEMLDIEYLIADGFLKRVDDFADGELLNNNYIVIAEESLPLTPDKEERLIESALRYDADDVIECFRFLSRKIVGEKLVNVSSSPYCADCSLKLKKLPDLCDLDAELVGWQLYGEWISNFDSHTVSDLFEKTSNEKLKKILGVLIKFGFADYALNADISSAAERLRMTFSSLVLSEIRGALIVFDAALSVFNEEERKRYFEYLKEGLSENLCIFLDEEYTGGTPTKISIKELSSKFKNKTGLIQLCGSSKALSMAKLEGDAISLDVTDCPSFLGSIIYEKIVAEFSESLAARLAGLSKSDFSMSNCSSRALDIKVRGLNIAEVLDLSVSEAVDFFSDSKSISEKLLLLQSFGFGDFKLSAPPLTVKEKERLVLVKTLFRRSLEGYLLLDDIFAGLSIIQQKEALLTLRKTALRKNFLVVLCSNRAVDVELYCVDGVL